MALDRDRSEVKEEDPVYYVKRVGRSGVGWSFPDALEALLFAMRLHEKNKAPLVIAYGGPATSKRILAYV